MAKNSSKPRPGVVLRFDWLRALEKLSPDAQARFLLACLYRGRDPTHEIDLAGLTERDEVRLETLWDQAAPIIDADGQGWADGVLQRRYAGYVSGCKRTGDAPMPYEDFRIWYETVQEKAPEAL